MSRSWGLAWGSAAGYGLGVHLAAALSARHSVGWTLVAVTMLLGAICCSWVFLPWTVRLAARETSRRWFAAALIAGLIVVSAIPITPAADLWVPRHKLQITALGQRHPCSQGYEVWVTGFERVDGTALPLNEFILGENWKFTPEGIPLHVGSSPSTLLWRGYSDVDMRLRMVSHPHSGLVRLTWDGRSQIIDLYCAGSESRLIPLPLRASQARRVVAGRTFSRIGDAAAAGLLALPVGIYLTRRRVGPASSAPTGLRWLTFAAPCAISWSIALLAFWPALMSPDSVDQWVQLRHWQLTNAHPAFHTFCCWLLTRAWQSTAAVAIAQIIALSGVVGYLLSRMDSLRAPPWLTWGICALTAISPANATLVATLWKDIPFAIVMLGLSALVLQIVVSGGGWLSKRFSWLWLSAMAALVILFRHNGLPAAYGTLLLLLPAYPRHWRRIGLSICTTLALTAAIQGPLYGWLQVKTTSRDSYWSLIVAHYLAAHLSAQTPLEPEEKQLLNNLWPAGCEYDPFYVDHVVRADRLNRTVLRAKRYEVLRLTVRLSLRRPAVSTRALGDRSAFVWRIRRPPFSSYYCTALEDAGDPRVEPVARAEGVDLRPLWPALRLWYASVVAFTGEHAGAVVWRAPLYLYLLLAAVLIAAVRSKNWRYVLLAVPVAINSLVLALISPGQDFRYQFPAYLSGMLLGPLLLWTAPILPACAPDRSRTPSVPAEPAATSVLTGPEI